MSLRPASTIECNPIAVDGVLFLTTPGLKVVALEAASGRSRWVFDPWNGRGGRGVNRGVTYWSSGEDRRIFFVAGNYLCAINAANGRLISTFGRGGKLFCCDMGPFDTTGVSLAGRLIEVAVGIEGMPLFRGAIG